MNSDQILEKFTGLEKKFDQLVSMLGGMEQRLESNLTAKLTVALSKQAEIIEENIMVRVAAAFDAQSEILEEMLEAIIDKKLETKFNEKLGDFNEFKNEYYQDRDYIIGTLKKLDDERLASQARVDRIDGRVGVLEKDMSKVKIKVHIN